MIFSLARKGGRRWRLNEYIGLFRGRRRMFLVEIVIIVIAGSDKSTAELLPG